MEHFEWTHPPPSPLSSLVMRAFSIRRKAASVGARMMRGFASKGMELKDIDAWVVLMQHSKNI